MNANKRKSNHAFSLICGKNNFHRSVPHHRCYRYFGATVLVAESICHSLPISSIGSGDEPPSNLLITQIPTAFAIPGAWIPAFPAGMTVRFERLGDHSATTKFTTILQLTASTLYRYGSLPLLRKDCVPDLTLNHYPSLISCLNLSIGKYFPGHFVDWPLRYP